MKEPLIFTLLHRDNEMAKRIADAVGGRIVPRGAGRTVAMRRGFAEGHPIVGLFSAGILIRHLAPMIKDKHTEPPVIAVAGDGSSVLPLLGGHHGANKLARKIAAVTGGHAAITTATDVLLGTPLDDPPEGYFLANPDAKEFAVRLLSGEPVRVTGEAPWLDGLAQSPEAELEIVVTDHATPEPSPARLVYHTQTLALGLGCERGTSVEEIRALIGKALESANLSKRSIAAVASLDLKADEESLHEAAWTFTPAEIRFFTAAELKEEAPRLKLPSQLVLAEVGTPSVAEAAALRAAGPHSELVVEKMKGARATCAIARSPGPITEHRGRLRGQLRIVGFGPGDKRWRGHWASVAIEGASDWVGYGLYLDLVADLKTDQAEHRFPLGDEEKRVVHALELAGEGKDVALLCSGDAGIYAMAALVIEVLDPASGAKLSDAARRVDIEVVPGVSAFQMAAARVGGFIGHDFCCISLSDLLTPWHAIERRVRAAAEADFVVAFYNPRSLKRTDQLDRALAILKEHRPADTPVVVASNLTREDEDISIVALSDFDTRDVDMLTIILIGSSQTRKFKDGSGATWAYTPRGYAARREAAT